jgi:DNA repair exonuclease SbcCD ATPase subunit
MIRRLTLQNWRAYENVTLDLEPGTTFVVARNGIGKSSLIEGATWALYGDAAGRPANAIRLGSTTATASVELLLPDGHTLAVTRQLTTRLGRTSRPPVSATIDDAPIEEERLGTFLRDALGGDPAFLARITMVRGAERLDPDASRLNLQEHLARYFGANGLRQTAAELRQRLKDNDHRIREVRQTTGPAAEYRAELRRQLHAVEEALVQAEQSHQAAAEAARAAEHLRRQADEYQRWLTAEHERRARLTELSSQIGERLSTPADADHLPQVLDQAEDKATRELDDIRRRRSELEGRLTGIRSSLEELRTATGQCPVCRRPLSAEDTARALDEHHSELAAITDQLASLSEEPAMSAVTELRQLRNQLTTLSPRVGAPPASPVSISDAAAEYERAQHAAEDATAMLVERRSAAMTAAARLKDAESDERTRSLLDQEYRDQALLRAAAKATEATLTTLLQGTITPLVQEITAQWKRLFSDRGVIDMNSQGELSRLVNGEILGFESFSTGEKMGAQILLRLLLLDTATRAKFCWVDEPLEHLDPDTRRQVALRLALTPAMSGATQMLVTTYEEPLVRHIAQRMPEHVRVLYVRASSDQ